MGRVARARVQRAHRRRRTEGSNLAPSTSESVSAVNFAAAGEAAPRPRPFPRMCPGAPAARSAESRRARQYRADPQEYLCRAIFQYRNFGDAVATSWWAKVPRLVPNRGASSGLRDASGSCEFGSNSSKAERCPLIVPAERQTGVREQLLRRQVTRLAPFENSLGDVRGEITEADNPSEIGSAHSFAQSKRSKGDVLALDQCRVEPTGPDEQLYHSRITFVHRERIGPVDQHPDLHACAAQPCWHGQDHDFLFEYAL